MFSGVLNFLFNIVLCGVTNGYGDLLAEREPDLFLPHEHILRFLPSDISVVPPYLLDRDLQPVDAFLILPEERPLPPDEAL